MGNAFFNVMTLQPNFVEMSQNVVRRQTHWNENKVIPGFPYPIIHQTKGNCNRYNCHDTNFKIWNDKITQNVK